VTASRILFPVKAALSWSVATWPSQCYHEPARSRCRAAGWCMSRQSPGLHPAGLL